MDHAPQTTPPLRRSRYGPSRRFLFAWIPVIFLVVASILPFALLSKGASTRSSTSNAFSFDTFLPSIRTYVEAIFGTARVLKSGDSDSPIDDVPRCKGPVCLDDGIGARLLQEEIYHLRNILDLVDGFGRPLGEVFDHHAEYAFRLVQTLVCLTLHLLAYSVHIIRLAWSINPYEGSIPDMPRQVFKQNVIELLRRNRAVDRTLFFTGIEIFGNFHSEFYGVGPGGQLLIALELLESTHILLTDDIGIKALKNNPRRYTQEVDSFVAATIKNFTGKVVESFGTALPEAHKASTEAELARTSALSLLVELDMEKSRVTRTLRNLPWWDRFTLAHFFRRSPTSYFREYLKFFDDKEAMIRLYTEWVQIVADNLLLLKNYADWYRIRQSKPIDARHIPRSLSSKDEIRKLREAIDDYIILAETRDNDCMTGTTPPHRLIREGRPFTLPSSQ